MSVKASQKAFISQYIKLDFFNNSNLKTDIQNRISDESEINFQKSLENIQGDNKKTKGTDFSELTLLAMAYFFECIFPKNIQINDADYSINSVKGFFDACNHTQYTAIYEVDTTCHQLRDTALFKACYLIIQSAWFFNSEYFGRHQHITYVDYYANTRKKHPESQYKYDIDYLNKKYSEVDENNIKGVYGFKMVEQWYYLILFLIATELKIPTNNFKKSQKRFREYNPLVKCSRMLRPLTPFKIGECDIKSAFPSFIDFATNGNRREKVYFNLQENHNINRSKAKVLFNKWCNSGKYKSISQTKNFLLTCGYSENECNVIITLTHSKEPLFYDFMCEYEKKYIELFTQANPHLIGARLHDALLFIDKKEKPIQFAFNEKCVFGFSQLNKPIFSNSFSYSNKRLRYAYVSSIPPATAENYKNLIRKQILTNPKVLGEANGFKFYMEKYEYISASFDLNQKYSFEIFLDKCKEMISTLNYLNSKPISKFQLYLILCYIRQNSNVIFNVRFLYRKLSIHLNHIDDIIIRQRDFELIENLTFRKKIDFLKALNNARGEVNKKSRLKRLFQMLDKRVSIGDFSFIDYKMKGKTKNNELLKFIVLNVNKLCTGNVRKPKAQQVKSNPLYSNMYKEGASYPFEPHKYSNKNRLVQRKIHAYEKELLRVNRLVNNREIAIQYLFILEDITGLEPNKAIQRNPIIIQTEKAFIMGQITGEKYKANKQGEKAFNNAYVPKLLAKIENHIPKLEDFNISLEHSAFNIDIEEAHNRGDQFFYEYLKFHKLEEKQNEVVKVKNKKKKMILPELDFDDLSNF